jgi:hypothetical protein
MGLPNGCARRVFTFSLESMGGSGGASSTDVWVVGKAGVASISAAARGSAWGFGTDVVVRIVR